MAPTGGSWARGDSEARASSARTAFLSILPFAVIGKASIDRMCSGTMYPGRHSFNQSCSSSAAVGASRVTAAPSCREAALITVATARCTWGWAVSWASISPSSIL